MLVAQGNLPEALKSFRDGLAITDRLAKADPGNAGWQRDLSVSYNKIGDVLVAQGNLPEALKSYRDGLDDLRPSGEGRPRQRRLAARPVGVLRKDRRRAGGAGQSAGGAEIVPRRARRSSTVWRRPTPATPAGSATCRCPTSRLGDVLHGAGQSARRR